MEGWWCGMPRSKVKQSSRKKKPLEKDWIEERLKMFDKLWDESPRVQKMKKQFREETEVERMRLKKEAEEERMRLQQEAEEERVRLQQERVRLQQEMEKARVEQEVEIRRSLLVRVIRARFPSLTEFVQQQVGRFDRSEVLDLLTQQVAVAPDANTVRLILSPSVETQE